MDEGRHVTDAKSGHDGHTSTGTGRGPVPKASRDEDGVGRTGERTDVTRTGERVDVVRSGERTE